MTDKEITASLEQYFSVLKSHFHLSHLPIELSPHDDDWTRVIKLQGFVEIALNRILETYFGIPRLNPVIRKLPTGHDRTGKLAFIEALDLLPDNGRKFVKLLCNLRATLGHDIGRLDFALDKYFNELDQNRRIEWSKALWWWLDEVPNGFGKPGQSLGSLAAATTQFIIHAFQLNVEMEEWRREHGLYNAPESSPKEL